METPSRKMLQLLDNLSFTWQWLTLDTWPKNSGMSWYHVPQSMVDLCWSDVEKWNYIKQSPPNLTNLMSQAENGISRHVSTGSQSRRGTYIKSGCPQKNCCVYHTDHIYSYMISANMSTRRRIDSQSFLQTISTRNDRMSQWKIITWYDWKYLKVSVKIKVHLTHLVISIHIAYHNLIIILS